MDQSLRARFAATVSFAAGEKKRCAKSGNFVTQRPCIVRKDRVPFLLRRARSAIRSKPLRRAVGGSRKFLGGVDESATGSANFYGPGRGADGCGLRASARTRKNRGLLLRT